MALSADSIIGIPEVSDPDASSREMDEQATATHQNSFSQPNLCTDDRTIEQIRQSTSSQPILRADDRTIEQIMQSTFNQPNAHTYDRIMGQSRELNWQTFNNQFPNMSTIRTPSEMSSGLLPNWHPSSSFQFVRPTGVVYMAPTNTTQNLTPALHHNVSYIHEPSQLKSSDSRPSKQSNKRNQTGSGKDPWTVYEDVELCNAWLNTSEDAIIATNQRKNGMWKRVTAKFHELMKLKGQESSRTKDALQSHWGVIHPAVTKWSALHATLTRNLESGWTVEQMESRVWATYHAKCNEYFKFEECWKVLRENYKWKVWSGAKDVVHEKGTQPVVEPTTQKDAINVDADSEAPLTSGTESPTSACPPPSHLDKEKDKNPLICGPASKDMPRPNGTDKAKNQNQRKKKKIGDQQNRVTDTINAAIIGVDARAEERTKRQEESKRRRDEILDQRFNEQK